MSLCYIIFMAHLSVNLNKIALLRNSRGKNRPSIEVFGNKALEVGVMGLTLHPRPDQRHAKYSDLPVLKQLVEKWKSKRPEVEFNVEGYPSEDFLSRVIESPPDQCTLVPDPPDALTSNAGWDFAKNESFLKKTTAQLKDRGIRVSLFLDPLEFNENQLRALQVISPDRVELYTESFAENYGTERQSPSLLVYSEVANQLLPLGFEINAGHDLNQENLATLLTTIPQIKEVSIGHALIEEALWQGFEQTLKNYLQILESAAASSVARNPREPL